MNNNRTACFESAKRIVVKVGSNLLTKDNGLNIDFVHAISRQICSLMDEGIQVVLVSSGSDRKSVV